MTLAAPALSDQWWFAIGSKEPEVDETYRLYNPTDEDAEVTAAYLGVPTDPDNFVGQESIDVPANSVVSFDTATSEGLQESRHAMVFSTLADSAIVVERVITRTVGGQPVTSVNLGAPSRSDGYVSGQWYVPRSPAAATENAIAVYNVDLSEAVLSVQQITDEGYVAVPGLDDVTVPSYGPDHDRSHERAGTQHAVGGVVEQPHLRRAVDPTRGRPRRAQSCVGAAARLITRRRSSSCSSSSGPDRASHRAVTLRRGSSARQHREVVRMLVALGIVVGGSRRGVRAAPSTADRMRRRRPPRQGMPHHSNSTAATSTGPTHPGSSRSSARRRATPVQRFARSQ